MHDRNVFLTLTYDEEHCPSELEPKVLQRFWKRARKRFGKFRYFACGEYGSKTLRPHYHALCFGLDFEDKVELPSAGKSQRLRTSPALEECWGSGHVVIGDVTYASAAYVAGYVVKKATPHPSIAGLEPEFRTMSRKPGIGKSWFDRYKGDVFPHDDVRLGPLSFRPPRYYDQQLPQVELNEYRYRRARRMANVDLSHERVRVRERCAIDREKRKERA